jgi:hypothetical protein
MSRIAIYRIAGEFILAELASVGGENSPADPVYPAGTTGLGVAPY